VAKIFLKLDDPWEKTRNKLPEKSIFQPQQAMAVPKFNKKPNPANRCVLG
jgi:hypothetical protein